MAYNINKNNQHFTKSSEYFQEEIRKAGFSLPLEIGFLKSDYRKVVDPNGAIHNKTPGGRQIDLRGIDKDGVVICYESETPNPLNNQIITYSPSVFLIASNTTIEDPALAYFFVFACTNIENNECPRRGVPLVRIIKRTEEISNEIKVDKTINQFKSMILIDEDSSIEEVQTLVDFAMLIGIQDVGSILKIEPIKGKKGFKVSGDVALLSHRVVGRVAPITYEKARDYLGQMRDFNTDTALRIHIQSLIDKNVLKIERGSNDQTVWLMNDKEEKEDRLLGNVALSRDGIDVFIEFLKESPALMDRLRADFER